MKTQRNSSPQKKKKKVVLAHVANSVTSQHFLYKRHISYVTRQNDEGNRMVQEFNSRRL